MSLVGDTGRESRDWRAQSTALGFALVIAIVVGGTTLVAVLGADALDQTGGSSELKRAEQTMTLLDSRAAMVALGTSDLQSLRLEQQSGTFETRPDAGWLAIKHVEYADGETETIYNESLGAIVYENGGTEIAYQGGGVWRRDPQGAAQMISPPEFHYRGATLTLPIIGVRGRASGSGSPTVTIGATGDARPIYPNLTADPNAPNATGAPYNYSGPGRAYANPIVNGTVRVFVRSDYYEGWAEYFRERTSGKVTTFEGNRTVRVTLVSLGGSLGRFPIPDEGASQSVRGVGEGHPIKSFDLTLESGPNSGGESHWSMYAIEDNKELEIHFELENGNGCRDARIAYLYRSPTERQEWETGWLDPSSSDAYDCTPLGGNDFRMSFNLTSRTDMAEYRDVSVSGQASGKWCFDVNEAAPDSTAEIDQHPGFDPGTVSTGTTKPLNWTTNHYLARLGTNYDLQVQDSQGSSPPECDATTNGNGGSNLVDEDPSVGVLEFAEAEGAEYITFLHITENEIEVDFD